MKTKREVWKLLWEARIVITKTIPEHTRMLEWHLLVSFPLISPLYRGCYCWRGEEASRGREYRGWWRVKNHLCWSASLNWWRVWLRGHHLWRGSWGAGLVPETDCFGHSWITDMLVSKLLIKQYPFIRNSHWSIVPSVKIVSMFAKIRKIWFRHRDTF